jgi:tetratricopeptide (TPR) repeat protein
MRLLFRDRPPAVFCCLAAAVACAGVAEATTDDEVATLIRQLGDDDFARRESAAAALAKLGGEVSDALLAAAESTADLEVALKARWLVESLPLATPDDPPDVAALLDRFSRSDYEGRVQLMHRLVRLDDDAGIEPLGRIVRLERTATGARIAAALLAREWQTDDPFWPAMAARIRAGLGPSSRPAARFLRAVVEASLADSPPAAAAGRDEAVAALATLVHPDGVGRAATDFEDPSDPALGDAKTLRIFRRVMIDLFMAAGRRDEALTEARRLLHACRGGAGEEHLTADEVVWLADHGLPEAADLLADRLAAMDTTAKADRQPLVAYAVAVAQQRRGEADRAAELADRSRRWLSGADVDLGRRLQAAMLLARWGAADWAVAEYESITANPEAPAGEFALAGILSAEFLHDQEREAEAAEVLRRLLEGGTPEDGMDQILMRLERDPQAIRSRMLYFRACAAAARGDTAGQRRLLEESLREHPQDVDTLIAWYGIAESAEAKADAKARVARALERIEEEIQALPDDPNGFNEYAWLVANTEGDIRRATRYAKRALERSFDSASYLDTLAHCRAAGGDPGGAYRTQLVAARHEPHSLAIRRNLARFRAAATAP